MRHRGCLQGAAPAATLVGMAEPGATEVAWLRFHGDLSELASHADDGGVAAVHAPPHRTVKDAVQACGVPHTEVALLTVGGTSVGFAHRLAPGDTAHVHPWSATPADAPSRVHPEPLPHTAFLADVHLHRLAQLLRLVGLDARYDHDADDAELARAAVAEQRWLLTRDRGLLMRSALTHGYLVRADDPREQLREVVARFALAGSLAPLTRCARCNAELVAVRKDEIADRLEPGTRAAFDHFARCAGCGQVFWRGAHAEALDDLIAVARRAG